MVGSIRSGVRRALSCLVSFGFLAFPALVLAAGSTESLLRLLPPDTSFTLSVDDLRGHYGTIVASPLARGIRELPAVQALLKSEQYEAFQQARSQIEEALQVDWDRFRDDILGDAVVLSFHMPAGAGPDGGRGLVMVRPRDKALMVRFMEAFNRTQKSSGELRDIQENRHGGQTYFTRTYADGRPADHYFLLDDGTFAWSNSAEQLIEILKRNSDSGLPSLWTDPLAREVRESLPSGSFIRLALHPGFLVRFLEALPDSDKPGEARAAGSIRGYFRALRYVGLSVEWKDGLLVHTRESLDPSKLEGWLKQWLTRKSAPTELLRKIPQTAVALSSIQFDFSAIADYLDGFVPENDRWQLENILTAVRGIALDQDVRKAVLPALGPRLVAYADGFDYPSKGAGVPMVAALGLASGNGAPQVAASVRNALRTMLAVIALDNSRRGAQLHLNTTQVDGQEVTTFGNARVYLAYSVLPDQLVVSNNPGAAVRYIKSPPTDWLDSAGAGKLSVAGSLAYVDLAALAELATRHRDGLAKRSAQRRGGSIESAGDDLDQAIALARLFRCVFFTTTAAPDASTVSRTFGLLAANTKAPGK